MDILAIYHNTGDAIHGLPPLAVLTAVRVPRGTKLADDEQGGTTSGGRTSRASPRGHTARSAETRLCLNDRYPQTDCFCRKDIGWRADQREQKLTRQFLPRAFWQIPNSRAKPVFVVALFSSAAESPFHFHQRLDNILTLYQRIGTQSPAAARVRKYIPGQQHHRLFHRVFQFTNSPRPVVVN